VQIFGNGSVNKQFQSTTEARKGSMVLLLEALHPNHQDRNAKKACTALLQEITRKNQLGTRFFPPESQKHCEREREEVR
jgi:hypothetical protein